MFKSQDYELVREDRESPSGRSLDGLLLYETRLKDALFEDGTSVKLSDLKNKFHEDLAKVKSDLYEETATRAKTLSKQPEYRSAHLSSRRHWDGCSRRAISGVPWVGFRRSAHWYSLRGGRLLVGFAVADDAPTDGAGERALPSLPRVSPVHDDGGKERQAFAERANLFEEYLPYAIVYGCVKNWSKAFEGLGLERRASGWYIGSNIFAATQFAESVRDFSSSISGVMASTPGGSGGSGFGGGGGSGGGGGGGGGGSW